MPTPEHYAEAAQMLERIRVAEEKAEQSRREYLGEFETVYDGKGWRMLHKETGLSMQSHDTWLQEQRKTNR